jgi:hypothetical protein
MGLSQLPATARVVLELEPEGEPIRGSISSPCHSDGRFHGWLELADALETARRSGREVVAPDVRVPNPA